MADLKLGKLEARPYPKKFSLEALVDVTELPAAPPAFGHEDIIGHDAWGMLANDKYGCCVWSGGAHESMLLNMEVGNIVPFDDAGVLGDYASTGFDPADPSTDQGTDVQQAANYRRTIGLLDAKDNRHKIAASLGLTPGNVSHLWQALYLFDIVGIGLQLPASAMDQFDKGQPWDVVTGSPIEGGHYVPMIAKRDMLYIVTWGKLHPMTLRFFSTFCDEARTYLSQEAIVNQKSPDGFDYATLQQAMRTL